MADAILAAGIHKSFGVKAVLRGVGFEIAAGEIYGLFGANGSGKSTLIRIVAGLARADSGHVRVCGRDLGSDRSARRLVGYVAQQFGLYDDLTVEENVRFYARCQELFGPALQHAIDRSLEQLGLSGLRNETTRHLSHGWKLRLSLASALCHQPRVLILDEVTAGIDPDGRIELWNIFKEIALNGGAVLLSTHHLDEAVRCSRTGRLFDGVLEAHTVATA